MFLPVLTYLLLCVKIIHTNSVNLIFDNFLSYCGKSGSNVITININSNHEHVEYEFLNLTTEFLIRKNSQFSTAITVNEPKRVFVAEMCNLIMLDEYETLEVMSPAEINKNSDTTEHYLIIWHEYDGKSKNISLELSLLKIFSYFLRFEIPDVNIIVLRETSNILYYTYEIYTDESCGIPKLKLLNTELLASEPFYLRTLNNWHQCPLGIVTWRLPPYINIKESGELSGIEWGIVKTVVEHLNASIAVTVFSSSKKYENFGDFYPNGTIVGPAMLLKNRKVDIAVGSIANIVLYNINFTGSVYYMETPIFGYIMPLWRQKNAVDLFIQPLQWQVWFILGLCVLLAIPLAGHLSVLSYFLRILLILIGSPTPASRHWRLRYFLILMSIMMIILRSTFLGNMFKVLGTHQQIYVRTFDDIVDRNYTILVTNVLKSGFAHYKVFQDGLLPVEIDNENELLSFDALEKYDDKRYVSFASNVMENYYYSKLRRNAKLVRLETVFYEHKNAIFYRKHSYIRKIFNGRIGILSDNGLIQKIRSDNLDERFGASIVKYSSDEYHQARPILLGQFTGLFKALAILYFCALIIFVFELLWFKYKRNNS